MKLTFLGTAAAERFPALWCRCPSCQTARERGGRDLRRTSALLINDDLLIDAGPDVVNAGAALGLSLAGVQAVLISHAHYDHLEPLTFLARDAWSSGTPLPLLHLYATHLSLTKLEQALAQAGKDEAALRLVSHPVAALQEWEITTGRDLASDPRFPSKAAPISGSELPPVVPRRYRISSFAARHGPPEMDALFFVVQQVEGPEVEERDHVPAVLYASDTGPFFAETWTALEGAAAAGLSLDAVVLDATLGTGHKGESHLNLTQMAAHLDELAKRGLVTGATERLAHHFSHYFTPPYRELERLLEPQGIRPAYDGLVINL